MVDIKVVVSVLIADDVTVVVFKEPDDSVVSDKVVSWGDEVWFKLWLEPSCTFGPGVESSATVSDVSSVSINKTPGVSRPEFCVVSNSIICTGACFVVVGEAVVTKLRLESD